MNHFSRIAASLLALGLTASAARAQTAQPPAQGTAMTQQQLDEEILKELKAIHQLLERLTTPQQPAAARPTSGKLTNLVNARSLGSPNAPLTMVEFTDLQCPYCRQYVSATFEQIKKNWIDTGKLRYISRDFPLDIHPLSMVAARAARCAGEQGKFWDMRTTLMKNANLLTPDYITQTAESLKLDLKTFASCSASGKYDADIQAEEVEGFRLGVEGTPTFLLGKTQPDSVEGPMIVGALPYALFDQKLKDLESAKK
jgi:protein-disulfide isomerase